MSVLLAMLFAETESSAAEPLPSAVRISESLHEGCPKTPGMQERLEADLGHVRRADLDELAIDLAVRVERRNGKSHGTLALSFGGVSIHRNASSTSCDEVLAALSMMAAIAIGDEVQRFSSGVSEAPSAVVAAEPPSPSSTQPSSDRTAPRRNEHVTRAPVRPRQNEHAALSFGAGFEVNANRGALLMATWLAQLTFPGRFEPAVRVGVARSTRGAVSSPRGVVAIRWSEITMAGCAALLSERAISVGPCLNAEVGRLEASVVIPRPAVDVSYLWLALGASGKVAWRPLPLLSVEITVGARSPLLRKELFFEPYAEPVLYRAPAISPFIGVGAVVHLP